MCDEIAQQKPLKNAVSATSCKYSFCIEREASKDSRKEEETPQALKVLPMMTQLNRSVYNKETTYFH